MTWAQAAKDWNRHKLEAKQQWAELTDSDLNLIDGHRDRLVRALRGRYGLAPEQAQKRIDWWLQNLHDSAEVEFRGVAHSH